MGLTLTGNYIFTSSGSKAFRVASNFTNYLQLGELGVTRYYLVAEIIDERYVVSGNLFDATGQQVCRLERNQVRSDGCAIKLLGRKGYELVDQLGNRLFRLRIADDGTCILQGRFYDDKGNLVAEGDENDLRVYKGPAVLGKSGAARGIVISG